MLERVYIINHKDGNSTDDYERYVKDKRVIDFINGQAQVNIDSVPDWFDIPDFEGFYEFLKLVEVLKPEYPFILMGETDLWDY